jgi:hypothetical protein
MRARFVALAHSRSLRHFSSESARQAGKIRREAALSAHTPVSIFPSMWR